MSSSVKERESKTSATSSGRTDIFPLDDDKYIAKLNIGSQKRYKISLGHFTDEIKPRGYVVECAEEGTLLARLDTLGNPSQYELVLCVSNPGIRSATAMIRQL